MLRFNDNGAACRLEAEASRAQRQTFCSVDSLGGMMITFRRIVIMGLIASMPIPAVGQNLGAGDILNLGNQVLKGLQQSQPAVPQPAPSTPQVQAETRAVPAYDAGQVYETQNLLAQLGYDPGPVDGAMGNRTSNAIRQFQAAQGLPQTGQVSPELLVLLRDYAGSSTISTTENTTPVPGGQTISPSFDCARAGNAVEFAICGSVILADKDRQLLGAYEQALAQSTDPGSLRLQQRSWIQQRNRCGGSEACLADAMDSRIGELQRVAATSVVPVNPAKPIAPSAAAPAAPTLAQSEPVTSPLVREDGILVHANGGLIVPGPLFSRGTPEFRQYRALERYLLHAASGLYPDELVPADNPSILAERARDYLPMADVRPYLCTVDEMNSRASDCMSLADASYYYSLGGGELDPQGDAPRESDFLWWRGANEFERNRNVTEFSAANGPRDRIIATAPETPVRLVYSIPSVVDSYDFGSSAFPVLPIGGAAQITPPGSKSVAINLADVVRPIPVSPAAAETLLGELQRRENGDPVIYVGVGVGLTPDRPHGGQPRWTAQTVFSGYFMDAELTRPLEGTAALSGQAQPPEVQLSPGGAAIGDVVSGSVIRELQLNREDGRIVVDFTGYREPTATAREAVMHIQASAARDIVTSVEQDENGYNLSLLASIVNDDTRIRYFTDRNRIAGQDEFAVQRNRQALRSEVAPRLTAEAPALPIPMRLYLAATLDEYDFGRQGFPVRTFQDPGIQVNDGRPFTLQSAFEIAPGFLPMSPGAAEGLVNAQPSDLRLRIDFDVVATEYQVPQVTMTVRPIAVALVTRDTVYFEETYVDENADDESALAEAALQHLGPDRAGVRVPEQPTGYPIKGIAPGMSLEAALGELSRSFSTNEMSVSGGVLRAEHGVCRYAGTESGEIESELGTICLVARVTNDLISRVILRQVVVTGRVSEFLSEWREAFGAESSRGDGAAPMGSIGREYLGWGAEIDAPRATLGRSEATIVSHEAELDITYLSPAASVIVARSDFPVESQTAANVMPEPAPTQMPSTTAEAEAFTEGAEGLTVVGIRLGMPLAEAISRIGDVGKIIYRATVEPAKPELVQDRYTLILIDNGESFVFHTAVSEGAPVIGIARRIPVNDNIPIPSIRSAFVDAYGAPEFEDDNGGLPVWRWEKPNNRSAANVPCVDHFITGMSSGTPPVLVHEEKDVDAILAVFEDAGMFVTRQDQSFFGFYLKERLPSIGLSMMDRLGGCGAFLNAWYLPSQTNPDQIWVHLVDPMAFAHELKNIAETAPTGFKSKL